MKLDHFGVIVHYLKYKIAFSNQLRFSPSDCENCLIE